MAVALLGQQLEVKWGSLRNVLTAQKARHVLGHTNSSVGSKAGRGSSLSALLL